jgi:hypothetical protein
MLALALLAFSALPMLPGIIPAAGRDDLLRTVQAAPPELTQRTTAPILPPLTPPQQPSWKQEIKEGGPDKESGS